ncbi:LysR family transcriptional regulator [Oceanobacillus picturae]|uniref:LysR family transcriptional regulator n=1 Tax=Oceanobacillus picturae TaxID=171693 RepID=UPI00362A6D6D
MYYDALKTFVTLADVGNFTRTSQALHISQPSVSLHIKNLEKEFHTELFIRSPKSVQITPTGKILYDRAKQIIAMYEQTKEDIATHHQSIQGQLKIGASFSIGEYILPMFLQRLQEDFPALELEVVIGNTEEIIEQVRLFQVDVGLIEGQSNEKELTVQPFMKDELSVICSNDHELAEKKHLSIKDLQQQTWITREDGSGTREFLNHVIRSNGLSVKSLLSISSNQGIKESVMRGMGLSLLSRSVISREKVHGSLAVLEVDDVQFTRTLSYIYSPVMRSKKNVETFIGVVEAFKGNSMADRLATEKES